MSFKQRRDIDFDIPSSEQEVIDWIEDKLGPLPLLETDIDNPASLFIPEMMEESHATPFGVYIIDNRVRGLACPRQKVEYETVLGSLPENINQLPLLEYLNVTGNCLSIGRGSTRGYLPESFAKGI